MFRLILALVVAAVVSAANPVFLEVYYEFTTGVLKRTLAKADIAGIVQLKMVAYGNTKFDSASNVFTCQHGAGECQSDALELCNQYLISGDINSINTGSTSMAAYPFNLCMEKADGDPTQAASCYASNTANSTVTFDQISACATNDFNMVTKAGMNATPTNHQYVPWVLVDGAVVDNTNDLLQTICNAYTGTPPASCKARLADENTKCYNN